MKMEHYLCHTDYPIWQVVQNANGPVSVTTYTNGMIKVLPPITAEEEAIKSRFGGNDESKKMQKYLLKQQFKGFSVSSSKGLHKGYDRFQTLLSQLEIHGGGVLHEDANQKFLGVFERDVKGTTTSSSSSNSQNVAFVSAYNTSNTNDVSTTYIVSSPSVSKLQNEGSASYTDEVAMIFMRIKKFHKRKGMKAKWNQDSRRRDGGYNGNKARDNNRRPAHLDDTKALVTMDGEDIDWSGHVLPPITAEEVVAREKERKAKTNLLMTLPEDHLAKFDKMADAKEMWEAIKSRFGGNDESKKMKKYLLKQQFKGFSVSSSKGLHKGYDMFQTLLSQLEIHGGDVLHEDANKKFLRVFERDVKGTTTSSSSSNSQNLAFVSAYNTSNTNDVSTTYSVFSPSVSKLQKEGFASYTDEINDDDLEEMDLKWQVAMIFMRIKKFHKRTGMKAKWNQDSRRRDVGYNGNKARDNNRRPAHLDDTKALVTMDGEDIDWSGHVEEDT
nr:ribonuclease H-like domain-containing protein [Tanacetum cinerariifolium]